MKLSIVSIRESTGANIPSTGSRQDGSAGTPSTLNEESFKQALSQFLVDFFSSKHLDQGIDILTQCLSKPLDILTLLDPKIKKRYPEFYTLFQKLNNNGKFSQLGLNINSNLKELRRLLLENCAGCFIKQSQTITLKNFQQN